MYAETVAVSYAVGRTLRRGVCPICGNTVHSVPTHDPVMFHRSRYCTGKPTASGLPSWLPPCELAE